MSAYVIRPAFGDVIRKSDGKTVSPCQSVDDPDFVAYLDWVNGGNQPEVDETQPQEDIAWP